LNVDQDYVTASTRRTIARRM